MDSLIYSGIKKMENKVKYFLSYDATLATNNTYIVCNKMEFNSLSEMQAFKNYLESLHEGKKIYFKMWLETTTVTNLI